MATSYFLSQARTLVRDASSCGDLFLGCCSPVSEETGSSSAAPVLTDISASWTVLAERRTSPECGLLVAFQHLQAFQHYLCSLGFDFHTTPLIEVLSPSMGGKGLGLQDSAHQLQLRTGTQSQTTLSLHRRVSIQRPNAGGPSRRQSHKCPTRWPGQKKQKCRC